MNHAANLNDLLNEWTRDFDDLPWSAQALRIEPDPAHDGTEFHWLFSDLGGIPEFELEWRDPADAERASAGGASAWTLEAAPNGPGLLLQMQQGSSVQLRAIRVRQDPQAIRLCSVLCLQRNASTGEWVVIYNSLDRLRSLQRQCIQPLAAKPSCRKLAEFLMALLESRFQAAAAALGTVGSEALGIEQRRALEDRFRIQFNNHGAKRTFRYWSPAERQAYLRQALDVVQVLRGLTDKVCVSGGAVLGYRREGRLIEHDDDLDIVVGIPAQSSRGLGPELEAIAQRLKAAGYRIRGHFFAHLWVVVNEETGQTLDVFVAMLEGDRASFYPSHRRALATHDLYPPKDCDIEGVSVPMPGDIDGYLEGVYGPQWQSPDVGFQHPWNRDEYADLSGPRRHEAIWTRGEVAARSRRRVQERPQTTLT